MSKINQYLINKEKQDGEDAAADSAGSGGEHTAQTFYRAVVGQGGAKRRVE